MYIPHFVYPFIHPWTLGLLPLLAIMNNAATNMSVGVSIGGAFGFTIMLTRLPLMGGGRLQLGVE